MLLYPVPTYITFSVPAPAVNASALIRLTVTPDAAAVGTSLNALQVPPVVPPGAISIRAALASIAAAPPT